MLVLLSLWYTTITPTKETRQEINNQKEAFSNEVPYKHQHRLFTTGYPLGFSVGLACKIAREAGYHGLQMLPVMWWWPDRKLPLPITFSERGWHHDNPGEKRGLLDWVVFRWGAGYRKADEYLLRTPEITAISHGWELGRLTEVRSGLGLTAQQVLAKSQATQRQLVYDPNHIRDQKHNSLLGSKPDEWLASTRTVASRVSVVHVNPGDEVSRFLNPATRKNTITWALLATLLAARAGNPEKLAYIGEYNPGIRAQLSQQKLLEMAASMRVAIEELIALEDSPQQQ